MSYRMTTTYNEQNEIRDHPNETNASSCWTEEEIQLLRQYRDLPLAEQAELLGRSEKAIAVKRSRTGIAPVKPALRGRRRWTKSEEDYLTDHFDHQTDEELADNLNRSVEAVQNRRRKLGLYMRNTTPWSQQEINSLKQQYQDSTNAELGEQLGRKSFAVKTMKQKLGLTQNQKQWTDDDDTFLATHLHLTDQELGEALHTTASSVENRRQRLNLSKVRRWTKEERQFILDHIEDMTDRQMAAQLQRSKRAVQHYRSRLGVLRAEQESHEVNKDFFKSWSSEMAYILGFIYGDGNILASTKSYRLTFNITDKSLLEKINHTMDSTYPISERTKRKKKHHKIKYRVEINSKTLISDLLKLGVAPNKTLIMQFPEVPDKYFYDFVRGYLDADGHVNHREGLYILFVSASKDFIYSLSDELEKRQIATSIYFQNNDTNGIYQLYIKKRGREKFVTSLYQNSTIHLQRKKDVFDNYYQHVVMINCIDCDKKMRRQSSTHKRCTDCRHQNKLAYERKRYYRNKYGTTEKISD